MYNHSTPTSHQQAFPPSPFPSPWGPNTAQPYAPYPYSRPDSSYVAPAAHQQGYYRLPYVPAQVVPRSKGTEYLRSLTSSVSNLDLSDSRDSQRGNGQPNSAHGQTHASGYTPLPSGYRHADIDAGPSSTRTRLHSNPSSPNYNKRLPPLPMPTAGHSHSYRYGMGNGPSAAPPALNDPYGIPPPLPPRPYSLPLSTYDVRRATAAVPSPWPSAASSSSQRTPSARPPAHTTEQTEQASTVVEQQTSPPRSFRPSVHPHSKPRLSDETRLQPPSPKTPRPHSDPSVSTSKGERTAKGKQNAASKSSSSVPRTKHKVSDAEWRPVIDLTLSSSSSEHDSENDSDLESKARIRKITPRSPARRRRATSEQPLPSGTSTTPSSRSRTGTATPIKVTPGAGSGSGSVQCAGYTRTGQPCKRLVKVVAPFLSARDTNTFGQGEEDERSERVMGRYCKDHAGMICQVSGFYWRSGPNDAGKWIKFDDFIPRGIGQQTQTLLRMTMESKLTQKEVPGYLYAYELKDLETPTLSFFKVGRTDNVPRRIGQWTNQCQSKIPTLRDIFPLPRSDSSASSRASAAGAGLHRQGTLTTSFLPGATTHRCAPAAAMKRWERLVHLELSERSGAHPESQMAFERVRLKCADCGMGHKEIFPLVKSKGGSVYEDVVVDVVCRWQGFVDKITSHD